MLQSMGLQGVGHGGAIEQQQCPYQTINGSFHKTRTKNFTIRMEAQKTLNSQSSLEKEEWS